jgi:hypothetical protein
VVSGVGPEFKPQYHKKKKKERKKRKRAISSSLRFSQLLTSLSKS